MSEADAPADEDVTLVPAPVAADDPQRPCLSQDAADEIAAIIEEYFPIER